MKIPVYGLRADDIEAMDNPQLEQIIIKSVEGRPCVDLVIVDYPLDRICSKPEVIKK
jgi:hypothetical protein